MLVSRVLYSFFIDSKTQANKYGLFVELSSKNKSVCILRADDKFENKSQRV
jgi:hypothetical protein